MRRLLPPLLALLACGGCRGSRPAQAPPAEGEPGAAAMPAETGAAPAPGLATSPAPSPGVPARARAPGPAAGTVGASARSAGAAGAVEATAETTGVVRSSRTAGTDLVTLETGTGRPLVLEGSLREELRRLTAARVRVSGTIEAGTGAFDVASYEVLDIGGERPHVGVLGAGAGGTLLLAGADTLRLEGAPADLARWTGAKVWIVGPVADGALAVRSYGIIAAAR